MPLGQLVSSFCMSIYSTSDAAPAISRATARSREGKMDKKLETARTKKTLKEPADALEDE